MLYDCEFLFWYNKNYYKCTHLYALTYRLIIVCEHDIICVYVCLYKCTNEINVLSTNSISTGGSINIMVMVMY